MEREHFQLFSESSGENIQHGTNLRYLKTELFSACEVELLTKFLFFLSKLRAEGENASEGHGKQLLSKMTVNPSEEFACTHEIRACSCRDTKIADVVTASTKREN